MTILAAGIWYLIGISSFYNRISAFGGLDYVGFVESLVDDIDNRRQALIAKCA